MRQVSPKVIPVCEDSHFLEEFEVTGEIDACKAEELARKARSRHIDISFTCAGTGDGGEKCHAQLKPLRNLFRPSLLLVGGTSHCPGCEYDIELEPAKKLSYRLSNFSLDEFTMAMSKGKSYENSRLDFGSDLYDAQNLPELYRKLASAELDCKTFDGYAVKDIIVDSRTINMHRRGTASIDGHPALVLGTTTPLFGNRLRLECSQWSKLLLLQDAFTVADNNPRDRLHFLLCFDDRHSTAYEYCYDRLTKVARQSPESEHRTNNAIFLFETKWKAVTDKTILDRLGCKNLFAGVITNTRQFSELKKEFSVEDESILNNQRQVLY